MILCKILLSLEANELLVVIEGVGKHLCTVAVFIQKILTTIIEIGSLQCFCIDKLFVRLQGAKQHLKFTRHLADEWGGGGGVSPPLKKKPKQHPKKTKTTKNPTTYKQV